MWSGIAGIVVFSATSSALSAQTPDAQVAFEVASVKPAAFVTPGGGPVGMRGGPGTADPGQITYRNVSIKNVLTTAYGVKPYQINGPSWMDSERYDIIAKLPPDTTKEQFNLMLQNLLKERFGLVLHHETKDLAVYDLVVGKNGPKFKEAVEVADPPSAPAPGTPMRMTPDKDGFPDLPAGRPNMASMNRDGRMRLTARMQQVSGLAGFLGVIAVDRPILDKTGLTGKYDFKLDFSAEGLGGMLARSIALPPAAPGGGGATNATPIDGGGVSLFAALQDQLGLKLEPKKEPVDMLVIDHVDKVPSEN
jgi:uncharacterized protein (TIGR03435 family)